MKLVWTKSHLPLSLVIRGITGEPCSHFAFVFDSGPKGLMFESNLLGTHPVFFASALKGFGAMTIVHEKDITIPLDLEDSIWDYIVENYDDKPYDYSGAVYTGLMVLRNRIFKTPIPAVNKWADTGTYYCDELYNILTKFIPSLPQVQVQGTCVTPESLWQRMKDMEIKT